MPSKKVKVREAFQWQQKTYINKRVNKYNYKPNHIVSVSNYARGKSWMPLTTKHNVIFYSTWFWGANFVL